MPIEILPEEIINQIAAGEVIENPSAVVKELIENAIDAGATQIDISLKDSGLKEIIIKDNGCGISKDELPKVPLRHATSKLKEFSDLYSIKTMGFRGEALASIFSVAKTTLISKTPNQTAYEISHENYTNPKESSCSQGTTIKVKELFYNTPARKKYLNTLTTELRNILDIVKRFEIFYHRISFRLEHNGSTLVTKPSFSSPKENLSYVLGKELRGNLLEVSLESKGISIRGFIANPSEVTYSFRKNQYFFVNGRYIQSKLLRDAVYEGFGSNLMTKRHPSYILFIDIDPEIIDVNVHPTKIEIRFENESEIYEIITQSIRNVFETSSLFKEFNSKETDTTLDSHDNEIVTENSKAKPHKEKDYFTSEVQQSFTQHSQNVDYIPTEKKEISVQSSLDEHGPLYDELAEYRILGQLDKTYIVVQTRSDLILVDQHVAEEKYYYELFKKQSQNKNTQNQKLLSPQIIHLDNSEMLLYKENKPVLESIGFEVEEFGKNEILIRAVPISVRNKIVDPQKVIDMLHDVLVNKTIKCVEEEKHSKVASMACRISVMAGDELTMPQMKRMVENLRHLTQPFNCPHGRPTFLKYSFKELEKKFKRVV